jgi:hypothetical protein
MILPGSYANGFAPRDGQPLYPELWRGCVGAWNPGLGPTGLTLRDWSGYGNHGTLTNMTAGAAWTIRAQSHAITFDGLSNQVRGVNRIQSMPFSVTIACVGHTTGVLWSMLSSGTTLWNGWYLAGNAFAVVVNNSFDAAPATAANFSATGLNVVTCIARSATSRTIWCNGIEGTTGTQNMTPTGTLRLCFGASVRGGGPTVDNFGNGSLLTCLSHSRVLTSNEIRLLHTRHDIAFDMAPRRRASVQVAAFNRRRRLLLGST